MTPGSILLLAVVLSSPRLALVKSSKVLPIRPHTSKEFRNGSLTVYIGWDEGVTTMKLGEKATLDITR